MILLVRLNPGLVGESRRTVHIVGVPDEETPTHRTAHCGLTIHAGQAELVTEPAACRANTASPECHSPAPNGYHVNFLSAKLDQFAAKVGKPAEVAIGGDPFAAGLDGQRGKVGVRDEVSPSTSRLHKYVKIFQCPRPGDTGTALGWSR